MSDQEYPWLTFEIDVDGERIPFTVDPTEVYKIAAKGIKKQLAGEISDDMTETEKNVIRSTRVMVKGVFLAFGGKILEVMFKSKDHPKPQKGDDLIEWYSNVFAQIAIAQATQGTLILKGKSGNGSAIVIDEICPIPLARSIGVTDTGTVKGSGTNEDPSKLECI